MHHVDSALPMPVNHVFVDYENVHAIDLEIIGRKTVHLTLLIGAQKARLDAALVEKFLLHAATVELIRLKSPGKNALDFILAYYVGRAVLADPAGYFHIISKDKGYDPLIEHLRSKHFAVHRHDDFAALASSISVKSSAATAKSLPPTVRKSKPAAKPKIQAADKVVANELEKRVLEHLRKPATNRPQTKTKLVNFLVAYLGQKITGRQALTLIENMGQAGHLFVDDKGKVIYHLNPL